MCRWFTYLGDEPQLLEDLVIAPAHAIVKQIDEHYLPSTHKAFDPAAHPTSPKTAEISPSSANDEGSPNPLTNMDGFGVGWWTDTNQEYENGQSGTGARIGQSTIQDLRPVVYRNIRPPLNDLVLKSLAKGLASKACVAHIRAGTGLTPVVETNCHPYTFGRHLFCHNGVLASFQLFRPQLLSLLPTRYRIAVLGTTDSEHIAAVYFYHLCGENGDWEALYPIDQMAKAMRDTIKLLEELKAEGEKKEYTKEISEGNFTSPHNALNLLVSSGSSLVAIRYSSLDHEAPSLYFSTKAGATLNRKFKGHPDQGHPSHPEATELSEQGKEKAEHGKHVIVASEPNTYDGNEWELLEKGEMITVDQGMELKREMLNV